MWSRPGNMPKYYPGLRDILPRSERHITWTRSYYCINIQFRWDKRPLKIKHDANLKNKNQSIELKWQCDAQLFNIS